METLTISDIKKGIESLGLSKGNHVIIHSALSSFGKVEGGVDTVIDALLEIVGKEGTIVFPSFGGGDKIFNPKTSGTNLGIIPAAALKRKDGFRSVHPMASVVAIGAKAQWLTEDHDKADSAHGDNTPYMKLCSIGGKILLLGVDLDRCTFLHSIEAIAELPNLNPREWEYYDHEGNLKKKCWKYFPGPHRDFIGLQGLFEDYQIVTKAKIGNCLAQLMSMQELLSTLMPLVEDDPAIFVSRNPNLYDGIWQRARVIGDKFSKENFQLSADSKFAGKYIEEIIDNLKKFAIKKVILSSVNGKAWDKIDDKTRSWYLEGLKNAEIEIAAIRLVTFNQDKIVELLKEAKTETLIIPTSTKQDTVKAIASQGINVQLENIAIGGSDAADLIASYDPALNIKTAFNPHNYAQAQELPFLQSYKTKIRKHIKTLIINDGLRSGVRTNLEHGHAEIKELLSILRCKSFNGLCVLEGESSEKFTQTAEMLMNIIEEIGSCPA